jgi:hypothetical protein
VYWYTDEKLVSVTLICIVMKSLNTSKGIKLTH